MSDAKDVLAEILAAKGPTLDLPDADLSMQEKALKHARDWIERWAPFVEAILEADRLQRAFYAWCENGFNDPMPNTYAERNAANNLARKLIDAALGKDKP